MTTDSKLIAELKAVAPLLSGKQREFYDKMIEDAEDVVITPIREVFNERDIEFIKNVLNPKIKECYKNAHVLAMYFDNVEYCEGKMTFAKTFGIDHAWNKVGDKYVDITIEIALGKNVRDEEYLLLGTYDDETITRVTNKTEFYGNIYREIYLEKLYKKGE